MHCATFFYRREAEQPGGSVSSEPSGTSWRVKFGFAMFIASISWPVLIPLLPLLGISGTKTAAFTGVMVVVAEVLMLAGTTIAGKEGFTFIKSRVFRLLKSYGPPREVSRARYRLGLVFFTISLALATFPEGSAVRSPTG